MFCDDENVILCGILYSAFHTLWQSIYFFPSQEVQVGWKMLYRHCQRSYAVLDEMTHFYFTSNQQLLQQIFGVGPHRHRKNPHMPFDWTCQLCFTLDYKHSSVSQTGRLHANTRAPHYQTTVSQLVCRKRQRNHLTEFQTMCSVCVCVLFPLRCNTLATGFCLADLHLRIGLPISFIFSGFLE